MFCPHGTSGYRPKRSHAVHPTQLHPARPHAAHRARPALHPGLPRLARAAFVLLMLIAAPDLQADEPPSPTPPAAATVPPSIAPPRPTLDIPRLEGPVAFDGRLDEPQWQKAAKVTGFHPYEPVETGEVTDETEVFVFYDAEKLYVGFHCLMKRPETVRAHIAPREDVGGDDQVGVYLDTYDDDRHAFVFYTTALGIQWDGRYTEPQLWNQSWDTVYYSKGVSTKDGYIVELAIPFRSLRFANKPVQRWGIAFTREFAAAGTKAIWPKISHEQGNYIAQAATLEGISGIASSHNLELQPTLVTQWARDPQESADQLSSPLRFQAGDHLSIAPGLTAKYGVSSNLTLDAALNPDFSQVESDATQLDANIRFALFYNERRPFFLEGTEAFQAPYLSLNSRSIVLPFAGLKLTGKEGPTTVGVLTAYDMQPQPSITYPIVGGSIDIPSTGDKLPDETPGFMPWELEGRAAQVSVARVARDVGTGSTVGVMLADKEVLASEPGEAFGFHRYAAADASLQVGQHTRLTGFLGYSTTGRRRAEEVTLQDGEGNDLQIELPERSIQGWAYMVQLRQTTRKLQVTLTNAFEQANFRAETAYLPLVGYDWTELNAQYLFEPKIPGVVNIQPKLYGSLYLDPGAENLLAEYKIAPTLVSRLARQNWIYAGYDWVQERPYDQFLHAQWGIIGYQSMMFKRLSWTAEYREGQRIYYAGNSVGYSYNPHLDAVFRPTTWFQLVGGVTREIFVEQPEASLSYFPRRWSGSSAAVPVYDQTVANATLNVNVSPAWSLRVTGRFNDVKHPQEGGERGVFSGGGLLSWTPNPGTAAYLGVSRGAAWSQDGFDDEIHQDWRIFLKLSYLWRV